MLLALGCASVGEGGDGPESGISSEERQVLRSAQRAAERGDPGSQAYMGTMYSQGRGVQEDPEQAMKWYMLAADQGHTIAQYNIAVLHATGRGVPQDHGVASEWFRKAAAQGLPDAQLQLGVNHYMGRGVPWDPTDAEIWFSRAAEGLPSERKPEAIRYRDHSLRLIQLLESAEAGLGEGQLVLGRLYAKGTALPQDLVEAYKWLSLAATSEDDQSRVEATRALRELAEQMTSDEIGEARRRSAEWSQAHAGE